MDGKLVKGGNCDGMELKCVGYHILEMDIQVEP